MYGGSVKLGRGGAAAGRKRNIHVHSINRSSTAASRSRLASGGGHAAVNRGRDGGDEAPSEPSVSYLQADETFSLVTRNPLNFAMALRLVPDLVEEISRVEARGETARIKFDFNPNNSSGNVINVGDKNFNFTWSKEMGELCDIYEECKNGEDGNGLLMESGGTWRRLNVQRVLDESTKKHVKMRSEEAERKNKSRKSIVLDHQNSTVKNQMKALAAAESNSWRKPFQRKEIPLKKSKPDPPSGSGLHKSVYKSGSTSTNPSKGRSATDSPLSSHSKQYGAIANPVMSSNFLKGLTAVPDATTLAANKTPVLDKDVSNRLANDTIRDRPQAPKSVLQSILPDAFDELPAQDRFASRNPSDVMEDQSNLHAASVNVTETKEKFNATHDSPVRSNDKRISENGDGLAASSRDGRSDSDTESKSSDSGSDSESLSIGKCKSPAGSRSGSSSDSDSDSSSSSKQAPDEDVDIMTSDDEKGHKSEQIYSKSPFQVRHRYNEPADLGNSERQDNWVSDVIEVEKFNPGDGSVFEGAATNRFFSDMEKDGRAEEIKPSSTYQYGYTETQGYDTVAKNEFKQSDSDYPKFSEGKPKRYSNDQKYVDKLHNGKRLKGKRMSQPFSMDSLFGESPKTSSPDSPFIGAISQGAGRDAGNGNHNADFQADLNQRIQIGSISESQLSGQKPFSTGVQARAPFGEKQSSTYESVSCGVENSENGLQTSKTLRKQNQNIDALHEAGLLPERSTKILADNVREKHLPVTDSVSKKRKISEKVKDTGRAFKVRTGSSPKDKTSSDRGRSPVVNGKGRTFQRELSELGLGESHEPLPNEVPGPDKQSDRKANSRHVENKPTDSFIWNSDSNRGKPSKNSISDSREQSPHISNSVVSGLHGGLARHKPLENMNIESEKVQKTSLEAPASRKMSSKTTQQQHGSKQTGVSQSMKETKKQDSYVIGGSQDMQNDVSLTGKYDVEIRTESSSDEISCSYTKYEKKEPLLKYPIKDFFEYKEYVKEYREKYESYSSLNKILESYRDEFSKLGNDLETYRGRDNKKYEDILRRMKSSFRQCGGKHKRLKKIFNVLHEELKHLKEMIKDFAASYTKD